MLDDRFLEFRMRELGLDRRHDFPGDLVPDLEYVVQRTVESVRPHVMSVLRVDELSGDANMIAGPSNAPFENVPRAQLRSDLLDANRSSFIGKGRISRDYRKSAKVGQRGDDVLRDAVTEILLRRIPTHVGERQHRDRRLAGVFNVTQRRFDIVPLHIGARHRAWLRLRRTFARGHFYGKCPDRLLESLHQLLAKAFVDERQTSGYGFRYAALHDDAPGFGQLFRALRQITPDAGDRIVGYHHLAQTDTDAKPGSNIITGDIVVRFVGDLEGQRRRDRVRSTGELGHQRVAPYLSVVPP
ncbi:MAG: hypothetical protein M5U09_19420 [Gammaproteobacteria bacterium]|nr:hypothetical protein [Gammaproteobacteria bacterium]